MGGASSRLGSWGSRWAQPRLAWTSSTRPLLRDRLERLRHFRDELLAFRGRVEDLTFTYRVPGFRGDDCIYLMRRGRIRKDLPYPKGARARERLARQIEEVYGETDPGLSGLEPEEAAEILLVARWFRMNPRERQRTMTPEEWLRGKTLSSSVA